MLSFIKNKILQLTQVTGAEVCLLADERILINTTTLKLVKGRIVKESERHFIEGFDELANQADPGLPVALAISGKGILYKKVDLSELPANPMEYVLPTANPDDFFVEVIKTERYAFIALIRKELLNKITGALRQKGFKLLSLSLCGIRDLVFVLPLLRESDQSLRTANYLVPLDEDGQMTELLPQTIDTNNRDQTEYTIGDQYIHSPSVIPFASAMSLLASPLGPIAEEEPEGIATEREDYVYSLWYRAALWTALGSVFAILLINFFIYNYYFTRNKELQVDSGSVKTQLDQATALKDKIGNRENYLSASGWNGPSKISYYGDRIAGSIPGSILLTGMKIYPVRAADYMQNEMTTFQKDTIELTGTCEDPTEIGELTGNLKNTGICKTVVIKNYIYKKETGIGTFAMEITTR